MNNCSDLEAFNEVFKMENDPMFFLIPISFSCGEDEEEKSELKKNGLGDAAVGSITSNSGVWPIPTILSESDLSKQAI